MKLIYVQSGGDYASLSFKDDFEGVIVDEIIERIEAGENLNLEDVYEIQVIEVGKVDERFVSFVRDNIQDYDDKKHRNFWLSREIVK